MPDALELPRVGRAIVPLMRSGIAVVDELVADWLPGLAAVPGALDLLAKPAARLRRVDPIGIDGRSLHMIDLPSREVRTAHVPLLPLTVGRQHKRPFARANQNSNRAHL